MEGNQFEYKKVVLVNLTNLKQILQFQYQCPISKYCPAPYYQPPFPAHQYYMQFFSPRLKHPSLHLTTTTASRTAICPVFTNTCILGPILSQNLTWTLQFEIPIGGYMLAGICHQDSALKHNFEDYNWDYLGHGHYVVGSRGYVYSDGQEGITGSLYGLAIGSGDCLGFQWWQARGRGEQGTLVMKKEEEGIVREFLVDIRGEAYRPCVYMSTQGQSCSLISYSRID